MRKERGRTMPLAIPNGLNRSARHWRYNRLCREYINKSSYPERAASILQMAFVEFDLLVGWLIQTFQVRKIGIVTQRRRIRANAGLKDLNPVGIQNADRAVS